MALKVVVNIVKKSDISGGSTPLYHFLDLGFFAMAVSVATLLRILKVLLIKGSFLGKTMAVFSIDADSAFSDVTISSAFSSNSFS